jgi:flagellar basal-body rod protein FlgG
MLEGLYSAAAGMTAQQQRMDTLANDVANVNTTGYKHTRVAFRDLLYTQDRAGVVSSGAGAAATRAPPSPLPPPPSPAATPVGRGFAQGALRETGSKLDVAIEGDGFLQVRRADGTMALTRDGSLRVDPNGRLTTQRGELLQPAITLPAGTNAADVSIAADGTVSAANRQLGRIQLVTVRAPQALESAGESLFVANAASGAAQALPTGRLVQGALESSNVDIADAMTQMMESQRSFQMASKAVQMQDQILQIANQVKA